MAYFIYLTVIEMKEQRKEAIKPFISFPYSQIFFIEFENYVEDRYFPLIRNFSTINQKNQNDNTILYPFIEIENVGRGMAKQISYSWEYDFSELIQAIGNAIENSKFRFENKDNQFIIYLDEEEIYNWVRITKRDSGVLPHIVEGSKGAKIELPISYTLALACLIYIALKETTDVNQTIDSNSLTLNLEYQDISRNTYKTKYEFKLLLARYDTNSEKQLKSASGEMFVKNIIDFDR
ncbi:hypothetical protein [Methanolacinia paynteri]|uniref:hypothetical protein n=1 Tax=Methanolacinia paynteri TaxID=230356 RepID=UPI00064EF03D|nr:hypothetical protein [Methanolacinia paynteri]